MGRGQNFTTSECDIHRAAQIVVSSVNAPSFKIELAITHIAMERNTQDLGASLRHRCSYMY